MAELQGPALVMFDSATFREEDFDGAPSPPLAPTATRATTTHVALHVSARRVASCDPPLIFSSCRRTPARRPLRVRYRREEV